MQKKVTLLRDCLYDEHTCCLKNYKNTKILKYVGKRTNVESSIWNELFHIFCHAIPARSKILGILAIPVNYAQNHSHIFLGLPIRYT